MATISLTTGGAAYTQSFNALANTGTTNNMNVDPQPLPGWFVNETLSGTRDNEQYAADNGGSTTGDTYSYGSAPGGVPSTERALGSLQSSSLLSSFGANFTNNTGSAITELAISFTGEQWRIGNTAAARDDRLDFQISTNATSLTSGTWTDVNQLDFTNIVKTAASAAALDGNLAANQTFVSYTITGLSIAPGASFWIRWNDFNAAGSDDGLAIDEFSLTPTVATGQTQTVTFSPTTVVQAEGNSGTTAYVFTVTRSGGTTGQINFSGTIAAGSTDGADFVGGTAPTTFSGSIPAGQSSVTVTVNVQGDFAVESNESFSLTLTTATNTDGTVTLVIGANNTASGTITNDDGPGSIFVDDVSLAEGDSGTTAGAFTVRRTGGATGIVSVDYVITLPGGAGGADGSDVSGTLTGTVTFVEGQTTASIPFTVNGDITNEPNETFTVALSNATGGASIGDGSATATITNDDAPPSIAIGDVAVTEGASGVKYLTFTVSLSKPSIDPVTVDYATSNGTATAGSDYLAVNGTVSFAPSETVKTISVPIVGDTVPEANETFTVNLSNPVGATMPDSSAVGTITNDDGSAYFPLAAGNFSENWTDTSRINANDNWSGVPYIIGYLGDIDSTDPTGADARTRTAANLGNVDVIANQTNPGTATSNGQTSGGAAEFQPTADPATTIITNPTIAIQGSGTADAPSIVLYMDASGRTDIHLTATLRDLDASADDAAQQVNVQYRTDPNGAWINVPGGYFADVTSPGSATQTTALDVVLPVGANNAPTLQIRILTTNASGSDEWVGIDDIVVASNQSPPSYSIADAAAFEGTSAGTTPISFTVTRSGDTSAASTVGYTVTFPGGGFSADAADFASSLTGTVSFAVGESSKTILLDIVADANPEADEAFTVTLSNPSAGSIADGAATGTIVNDDGAPPFVTIADVVQSEGNTGTTIFTFTVTRTGGSGAFQVSYATTAGTATAGDDYVPASGTLNFAAGDNSETFAVTVNGDSAGELAETFGVQLSNPTNFAVLADPTATGTIQNDDLLFIHQIQGSSYYSPILKSEGLSSFNTASTTIVVIQAVVTAVDNEGNRQGFYITEESAQWDANSLTSEGIFVMTRDDAGNGIDLAAAMTLFGIASLTAGDLITVSAKVMEYQNRDTLPRTMLVNPSAMTVNSSGNVIPELVLDAGRPIPNSILTLVTPDLTDSVGNTFDATRYALSFWETVEHMVVTIPDMVVADGFVDTAGGQPFFKAYSTVHADADQINSRGGYTVAGDPPNSPPDTADADDNTIAGGRHVHDGDINPDIIEIDFTGAAIDAPAGLAQQATMGDALGDVTGIVEFDFENLKLLVTKYDPAGFVNEVPERETTALGSDGRALTVATFNVENLWADPSPAGQARFTAIADAIATNLNSPDIIMIEEIQDNNGTAAGTTDASLTWQTLVDALNARVPGARYQWVDQPPASANADGGAGNGNIRVGFLYDTNRVQLGDLAWDAPIEDRRKYTDRIGDGVRDAGDLIRYSDDMVAADIETANWASTRKSLLAQFTFAGNELFLVANHFTAKSGSGDIWQIDQDLAAGQPANDSWAKRAEQANDVYAMINYIQAHGAGAGIVSGGDYNDFYFYRPLEVITGYVLPDGTARSGGARFDNLTVSLAEAERFSYNFDGRSQALDHIISSQTLSALATYDIVHINTGYNSRGSAADADPSLSDHDPAVASFDFRGLGEVLVGTSGPDTLEGFGGDDTITGGAGNDTIDGGDGNDTVDYDSEHGGGDVIVNLSTDQVFFGVQPGHAVDSFGNDDTLISIENVITCDGNDKVLGSTGDNRIETDGGDDYIDGNGGTDTMIGGDGEDIYVVDSTDDVVTEYAGAGFDEIRTGLAVYTLADEVEKLVYTGAAAATRFTFNATENLFAGGAANDFLLLQQGGDDNVSGGAGNDIFFFGAELTAEDVVDGGADYDTIALQGDYSGGLILTANVTGIEAISLLSGASTRFGDTADNRYDYDITVDDANFSGGIVKINGGNLLADEDFRFDGAAEDDARFLIYGGFGEDRLTGGQQSDIFFFDGGTFQIGDVVDGAGGYDGLFLRGNYTIDFNDPEWGTPFTNIENITVTSVADTRYASGGGGPYHYSIVFADALLGAGQTLTVNGALLQAGESLNFDGHLEQGGNFRIFGGGGNDVLRGGLGNDLIYGDGGQDTMSGGGGNDIFRFDEAGESTSAARDGIQDFETGDIVDLSRIDADIAAGGDQGFKFIGTDPFSHKAGELRYELESGNIWKVQGDTDGDGSADLELFLVVTDNHPIVASDFFL
jgi:predicted extracellular nuclease/Ca2+-binding RTX toxin-like protein